MKTIPCRWCLSQNVGDTLTTWLFNKITGGASLPVYSNGGDYHILGPGSILNWSNDKSVVWGSGISAADVAVNCLAAVCVRGQISLEKLSVHTEVERDSIAIGDPGLLVADYFYPEVEKKYEIGIIPHYVDQGLFFGNNKNESTKIINVLDNIETVLSDILSCKKIYSSSLHGLIFSDAYGIPNRWFKFSDNILGDGTKFLDYYTSIGVFDAAPVTHTDVLAADAAPVIHDISSISKKAIKSALFSAMKIMEKTQ
jgi:pyruvyltransferase